MTQEELQEQISGYEHCPECEEEIHKVIRQHVEDIIGKPNDAMPSPQAYYADTPDEVIYELGKNDGRNELIAEQRKRAGL